MGVMRMRAICPNCGGKIHTQAKGLGHLTWMANGPLLVKTATTCQFCGIALTGKVDMQNRAILAQAPSDNINSGVISQPDLTVISRVKDHDIETVTYNNGMTTFTAPDGSQLVTSAHGVTLIELDGTRTFTGKNGSTLVTSPDGTKTITHVGAEISKASTPPDEATIESAQDGTVTFKSAIGSEIVNAVTLPNGTAVTTYSDGRIVSVQLNGVRSVRHLDGTLDIDLANGQKTTISSDGKTVTERVDQETPPTNPTQYKMANRETVLQEPVLTAQDDGSRGLILKGGNTLTIRDDGTLTIDFSDGREATIRIDGSTSFEFPDGREVWIYNEGTASVELRDGLKSWIHDDGTLSMDLPNGQEAWIYDDGSMELTDPPSDS